MDIKQFTQDFVEQLEKGKVVAITGAGMSTASGVRDFRGDNGLYLENVNAEEILTKDYFESNTKEFYDFYREHMIISDDIKPNEGHYFLKSLEDGKLLNGVITQNIDGLDLKVGLSNVIEIHGNGCTYSCVSCKEKYGSDAILNSTGIPRCNKCGGILRPNIVFYKEKPKYFDQLSARELVLGSKTLLIMGSTVYVEPIVPLVKEFYISRIYRKNCVSDSKIFVVNKGKTALDGFQNIEKYDGLISDFTEEYQRVRKTKF